MTVIEFNRHLLADQYSFERDVKRDVLASKLDQLILAFHIKAMTQIKNFKKMRVFVASPGDVSAERARLTSVIEALNRGLADHFGLILEIKDWHEVVPNMGRAEEIILKDIPVESWDIFIGILWCRFGTPTGAIDPATKDTYLSGTEEEFRLAYQSWKNNDGKPRILFYRCVRPPTTMIGFDFSQAERVKEFFDQFDATRGNSPGLYRTFDTPDDFERMVRQNLEKLVIEYAEKVQGNSVSPDIRKAYAPETPSTLPRREPFFGRKNEIAQALRALSQEDRGWGLIIDGIGGIGKSALAIEVAHLCKEKNSFDAFIFVTAKSDRLTPEGIKQMHYPVTTLDGLINEVARGLGLSSIAQLASSKDKQEALRNALSSRRALIIFDNAETLPMSDQIAISDFLRYLPQGCKAIVTSRRRGGEAAVTLRLEKLKMEEAWELVQSQMEKFGDVRRALTFSGPEAWKQLYSATGGSPLALLWTLGLIHARGWTLERGIQMLREGGSESDLNEFIYGAARRTMDASDLLALGALSLFGGPASFDAIAATADLDRHVLDLTLERLRAMSLVDMGEQSDTQVNTEERYTLHPLTRRFARADLESSSATAHTLGERFVRYWVNYATQFGGNSEESYKGFEKLESEWVNLDSASKWLWENATEKENLPADKNAARMLNALAELLKTFLLYSGRWDERRQLNTWAYYAACTLGEWYDAGWRAYHVAFDNYNCRRTTEAESWLNKSEEAWSRIGALSEKAEIHQLRGLVEKQRGNYEFADFHIQQAIAASRAMKRDRFLSSVLNDLGDLHYQRHDFEQARVSYEQALNLAESMNYKIGQAVIGGNLGLVMLNLGKLSEARTFFERELILAREIRRIDLVSAAQCGLARLAQSEGQTDLALSLAEQALAVYERLQHRRLEEARQLVERLKAKHQESGPGGD